LPRWTWIALAGVVGVSLVIVALGRFVSSGAFDVQRGPAQSAVAQPAAAKLDTIAVDASSTPIEVPVLVGLKLDEAKLVLDAAGLVGVIRRDPAAHSSEPTVTSQDPAAGALARAGATVTIVLPSGSGDKDSGEASGVRRAKFVVCIDPGHQSHSDSKTEPIGPGSTVVKSRITGGTTGIVTGAPEYETVLQIATNLKGRLEASGITVVMTRSTNDENHSNAERAQMASAAKADLFVRLHADSNTDEKLCGVSAIYPANIPWTKNIAESSKKAAQIIESAVVKSTRAVDMGVAERGDLAGFNWSTVPSVSVSVGFPSNRVEDRLLVSPKYQDQIAEGLANGTLEYLDGQH